MRIRLPAGRKGVLAQAWERTPTTPAHPSGQLQDPSPGRAEPSNAPAQASGQSLQPLSQGRGDPPNGPAAAPGLSAPARPPAPVELGHRPPRSARGSRWGAPQGPARAAMALTQHAPQLPPPPPPLPGFPPPLPLAAPTLPPPPPPAAPLPLPTVLPPLPPAEPVPLTGHQQLPSSRKGEATQSRSRSHARASVTASRWGPDVLPVPTIPATHAVAPAPAMHAAHAAHVVPAAASKQHDKPAQADQAARSAAAAVQQTSITATASAQELAVAQQQPGPATTIATDMAEAAVTQSSNAGHVGTTMLVRNPRASDNSQIKQMVLNWQWGKHSKVASQIGVTAHVWQAQSMGRNWLEGMLLRQY